MNLYSMGPATKRVNGKLYVFPGGPDPVDVPKAVADELMENEPWRFLRNLKKRYDPVVDSDWVGGGFYDLMVESAQINRGLIGGARAWD